MPIRLELPETFTQKIAATDRGLAGMWLCSGSTIAAEIAAGSGLDWILIDGEHSPLSLESIQQQLQVIAAYPITPVVRTPVNDTVLIKQYLDLGVQNLLIPMVNTAEQAEAAVAAAHYPPRGVRGVGSALARGARWNRVTCCVIQQAQWDHRLEPVRVPSTRRFTQHFRRIPHR